MGRLVEGLIVESDLGQEVKEALGECLVVGLDVDEEVLERDGQEVDTGADKLLQLLG